MDPPDLCGDPGRPVAATSARVAGTREFKRPPELLLERRAIIARRLLQSASAENISPNYPVITRRWAKGSTIGGMNRWPRTLNSTRFAFHTIPAPAKKTRNVDGRSSGASNIQALEMREAHASRIHSNSFPRASSAKTAGRAAPGCLPAAPLAAGLDSAP